VDIESLRLTEEDHDKVWASITVIGGTESLIAGATTVGKLLIDAQLAKALTVCYTVYKSEGVEALVRLLDEAHESGLAAWDTDEREIPSRL